jgi:3-dehydroquinate synthase
MKKPNIILTGFMATGKTTVGKLLAKELGYEFVDTDELIEARSGMTVAEIFRVKGETAFRDMESDLARELAAKQGLVISTGGRMMLDPDNTAALSKSGRVFCLVATPEEILQRVEKDTDHRRPLLEVPNPIERVVELLQQRKDGYGRFPQMETSDRIPEEVTKILTGLYQANPDLRVSITSSTARYEFIVGGGILPFVTQLAGIFGPVAVITDSQVGPLYARSFDDVPTVIEVVEGGQHKTLATVEKVYARLLEADFDRSGTIVALGGAVISELAGFVAATYMRGADCVQCPTSLLSMVDTSIGGKAGVDLPEGQNLIGAFKQPKAVIADVATLQSLPAREFASGMAEIIKHSLIADTDLLDQIEKGHWKHKPTAPLPPLSDRQSLVAQAIQVKVHIVQEDPFDAGPRQVLNLGHTFAHAIEQVSGNSVRHGEAVAMGLVAAAALSARLGHCSTTLPDRVESVVADAGLPVRIPATVDPRRLIEAMGRDKKKTEGRIRFVLLRDIGDVFVADTVKESDVLETLKDLSA